MSIRNLIRVVCVLAILAVNISTPAAAQSRKGKWGFGDNRYFIIDQVCRDGMELSAINSSALNPPSFQSATPIDIGARLYTNTAITLPVWSDENSRSPAADYGPQLAPLTVFTMTPEIDPLPADTNNNSALTPGDEYFDVYMNGEFLLWTEVLTPGARVIATHSSFNDGGQELGYESLTVEDCYFHQVTARKSASTTISSNLLNAGGSLQPSQVVYRLTRKPEHGNLLLSGTPLTVSGTFTQADVNAGLISYQHNGDSAMSDTFRFDMAGLALVSVNSAGVKGNATSTTPSISGDGQKVAFWADSTNLVISDTNGLADIFVRNVVSSTTVLATVSITGTSANGAAGLFPAISDNGRYVAFSSAASNLINSDTNTCPNYATVGSCPDIFVRDLQTNTITRVSVSSTGVQANGESANPAISADGRYVVFESLATNLVLTDTNGLRDVFLHDRTTGITTRISVSSTGVQTLGGESFTPAISANGQVVAFGSLATNLVGSDSNGVTDVFVHNLATNTTTRVSVSSAGVQGNSFSSQPALSADGRFVAFTSVANNLVDDDSNANCGGSFDQECGDVFVHDRQTGATRRVSLGYSGQQVDFGYIDGAALSADGSQVAFTARAGNVVFPDNNSAYDVFVHDWVGGTTVRASTTVTEAEGDSMSYYSDISDDGQSVAFDSFAQLTPGDPASTQDIYVRYLGYSQTFTIAIRQQIFLPIVQR